MHLDSLDRAIARYQSVVADADTIENAIGLAVCFNEKAELLGSMKDGRESASFFRRAEELLEAKLVHDDEDSPRGQYELARTMFLMSIQRQERSGGNPRGARVCRTGSDSTATRKQTYSRRLDF